MSQLDRLTGLIGYSGVKIPVRAATTAAIVLSGLQTVDGVVLAQDDRILVNDQADNTENGIYIVDSGDWNRSPDCDGVYDLVKGSLVFVNEGTTNTSSWFYCTAASPVPDGSTAITWGRASSALAVVSAFMQGVLAAANAAAARLALGAAASGSVTTSDITMNTAKILGRTTAAVGAIEEISISPSLTLSAGSLAGTPATDSQAGVIEVATQAEQETGTSTAVATTPGTAVFHNSACKGWGKININGTAAGQFNISSVTDNGAGDATINWANAFSDTTYCAVATAVLDPAGTTASTLNEQIFATSYAAGTTRITSLRVSDGSGVDPSFHTIAAFGDRP